ETLAKNAKKVGANKSVVNYILQIDPNDDFGKRLLAESKSLRHSNMIPGTPSVYINGEPVIL
ncbi:MAG: hypothetical protein LBB10_03355, partial [Bifidobacteriaceae bacterium]|nr:hypothetical protein [Bifidobacteriaceae bacterium]